MAKTRGALQKEFNAELKKEKELKEKIARYDREGIEVSKEMRQELSDLQKYTRDTKKILIDMYTKGSDAANDAKDAALEYATSVGDKLSKAAQKGGDTQEKVYKNTKGIWAELIKKRLEYEDAGKDTSQIDKLLEVGEEFLGTSQMTADQVENMKKTLGGIDMEGLGVSAEDLFGNIEKGVDAMGLLDSVADSLNLKALNFSAIMTAVTAAISSALDSAQKLTDELGVSASRARQMEFSFKNIGVSLLGFRDDFQLAEVAAAKTFGSLKAAENTKLTERMALVSKTMGITADQAAELTYTMTNLTGLSQEQAAATVEAAGKMAELNDVAPSVVLADMADNAGVLAKFSDGTAEGMARAAIQAEKLGINLSKAGQIADGLLDLETSMTNEMEASVLLGRDINLDRARQLALNNDIEGAMNAVLDQLGSEEEFNKLNAIQRQALADSIGVGVEDLASMVAGDGAVEEAMPKAVSKTEFQILKEMMLQSGFLSKLIATIGGGIAGFAGFKFLKKGLPDGLTKAMGKLIPKGAFKNVIKTLGRVALPLTIAMEAITNLSKIFGKGSSGEDKAAGVGGLAGAGIGAAIGTLIAPGIGTAIGISVGGFIGRKMGPILEKTKIGDAFKTLFSGIGDSFAPVVNSVKRIIGIVTDVFEGPGSIGEKIGKALGKLIVEIPVLMFKMGAGILSATVKALDFVFIELPKSIAKTLYNARHGIADGVKAFGVAILDGIKGLFSGLIEAAKQMIADFTNFSVTGGIKSFFGFGDEQDDFVQRRGQKATPFDPQDTIIGVKDPTKMGGGAVNMAPVTNELSKHTTLLTEISANTRRTAEAMSKLQITSGA